MNRIRMKRKWRLGPTAALWLLLISFGNKESIGQGFLVQLPTQGAFTVNSGVAVPDGGSTYLGGTRQNAMGMTQRGPARAFGQSNTVGGASVHTSIINLDELDQIIRSQANQRAVDPKWSTFEPRERGQELVPERRPDDRPPAYAYMLAMSHSSDAKKQSTDDARYYLSLAADARRRGHWSTVELYYKLAWESLPQKRREAVYQSYTQAKSKVVEARQQEASTKQKAMSSVDQQNIDVSKRPF